MLTITQTSEGEFSTATPTLARALVCARQTSAKVYKTHVSLSCAAAELRRAASATMSANVGRTGAVMSAEPPNTRGREEKLLRRRGRRAAAYNAPNPPPPPPAPVTPPPSSLDLCSLLPFPGGALLPKSCLRGNSPEPGPLLRESLMPHDDGAKAVEQQQAEMLGVGAKLDSGHCPNP